MLSFVLLVFCLHKFLTKNLPLKNCFIAFLIMHSYKPLVVHVFGTLLLHPQIKYNLGPFNVFYWDMIVNTRVTIVMILHLASLA